MLFAVGNCSQGKGLGEAHPCRDGMSHGKGLGEGNGGTRLFPHASVWEQA
jgi:hypothetical protein